MLKFKNLYPSPLHEEAPALLRGHGAEAERHAAKYIKPNIGKKEPAKGEKGRTLTYAGKHPSLKTDHPIHVHGHHVDEKGVHHVTISHTGNKKDAVTVKQAHIRKGSSTDTTSNKGHEFEQEFVKHAQKHGVMPLNHKSAGSTAGADARALDKRTPTKEHGKDGKRRIWNIEVKKTKDTSPAFGQATIHHSDEKGWHIPEHTRKLRPKYSEQIEKSGVLNHMNKVEPKPKKPAAGRSTVQDHKIHTDNVEPAKAYLQDHHAHLVHTSHGTYTPHDKDPTGFGHKSLSGKGVFTVRGKTSNHKHRTVQFQVHAGTLPKDSHNLGKDEDMRKFAKHLGHDDVNIHDSKD